MRRLLPERRAPRARPCLRTELLWTLALKLALVVAIKLAFFSQPVSRDARQQALARQFALPDTADTARQGPLPSKETTHDQRATR